MMMRRVAAIALLAGVCTYAGSKGPVTRDAEDASVAIKATVFTEKEDIKSLIGSDLDGYYVVVKVEVEPKSTIKIYRDDFLLRTDRDGEKSTSFSASQIAGKGALVVTQTYGGGAIASESPGPAWGGIGGPPGRLGNPDQGVMGNSASVASNQIQMDEGGKNANPLKAVLEEHILKEGETGKPVSGLLYFPMEPKQKSKQLELRYTGGKSKIIIRFK